MQKSIINPWHWQDQLGYAQAVEIPQATHTLYCAGQAAMDADGRPVETDMSGQINLSFDNLETVLQQANYSLANVVRLNFYTTSLGQFFAAYGQVMDRLAAVGCAPASTLTEVNALAFPQLMVEIEATAVK
ncbi:RidA family protein [Spirosoma radiotolerans]|uniref:Endoribonuclease L-PSP n=1 Tax=Spirosoma radiotolerans TaxID=1379870 RepID=A0A0E3ZTU9_9BACT|nr:RidA family protein [Spirosoma radiotolerans]AKD54058.1 endoribonuclease L-PSP [Spirosoma radiotolerans]